LIRVKEQGLAGAPKRNRGFLRNKIGGKGRGSGVGED